MKPKFILNQQILWNCYTRNHPNHTFKGLIKSQILRYVRICNNKQDVMIACRKFFAALVRRGYSERFLRKIKDKTLCELRKNSNRGSSQRCTTRNCKLYSTQVVVESGKTMGCVLDVKFKFLPHKIVIQLTVFTVYFARNAKNYMWEKLGSPSEKRINIHRSDVWLKKELPHTSIPGAAGRPI